jgi:DNA-binding NarL/FixJ family response regulator
VGLRVMVADDDPLFRGLVRRLLGESVMLVGEAADGEEAVALFRRLKPDVVLMDLEMPHDGDGLEATRRIKAEAPEAKVVLLTSHEEEAYLNATGKSGADVLLPKRAVRFQLLSLIRGLQGVVSWDGIDRRSGTR